jgi:prefoldin beta subunit
MTSEKETENKISQLQLMEQGLQNFNIQKQQLHSKFLEFESAINELDSTDTSYKIIGNIMVKKPKDELKKELGEIKENTSIRLKAIEKQEDSIREKAKSIQQEVLKNMKDNNSKNKNE